MRARVITASDRAAAGEYPDRSGPLLVAGLTEWGFSVPEATVVPDGPEVGAQLRQAIASGVELVLTTGGTGISPRDHTAAETAVLLDRLIPGIPEALRAFGQAQGVATAMLSGGLAGVAGRTLIVNLPGSPGGCRDGLRVLAPVIRHAVAQIAGVDHPPGTQP
jgi:molybdenum cofactor synthesis domain-containing protein